MEKFAELKLEVSSFSNFYFEFIWLALNLEYTSEIFIQKFKYKLIFQLQDWLNSGIEFLNTISVLAKYYLSIYK